MLTFSLNLSMLYLYLVNSVEIAALCITTMLAQCKSTIKVIVYFRSIVPEIKKMGHCSGALGLQCMHMYF